MRKLVFALLISLIPGCAVKDMEIIGTIPKGKSHGNINQATITVNVLRENRMPMTSSVRVVAFDSEDRRIDLVTNDLGIGKTFVRTVTGIPIQIQDWYYVIDTDLKRFERVSIFPSDDGTNGYRVLLTMK